MIEQQKCKTQHYMQLNIHQCWNCSNKKDEKEFEIDGKTLLLPECRVSDMYMTFVYDNPCGAFKSN